MDSSKIKYVKIQNREDLEKCFPLMKELRPHLSEQDYLEIYRHAHAMDGYEIVALEYDGKLAALMGYRLIYDFVRGKHLYIDDLVSTDKMRSQGLGAELLKHAESIAQSLGCKTLRLCTGVENERGKKFYEKNKWTFRAYAFTKKI
ncbi:GNAT family N-acetyltransferase [Bdellovibrio sp. HCB337]|uniref:GNAT family N-acetyltransferase n=1 Tax=Bdellovibrio sp. HCB337 TaxID=3394358 RepID=UPI0039A5F331